MPVATPRLVEGVSEGDYLWRSVRDEDGPSKSQMVMVFKITTTTIVLEDAITNDLISISYGKLSQWSKVDRVCT